jgi:hypothetical protein
MTELGDHAIAELTRIGAPDEIKTPLVSIVGTFADVPAPETNWPVMRQYLDKLLRMEALTQLTNDPDEWTSQFTATGNAGLWQNIRTPGAYTHDPTFATYFLIGEVSGSTPTVLYPTEDVTP